MLRIGPAGWDYQDWQGVVYPPGLKGTDRLTYLAAWFDVVEINVTFYRPLGPQLAPRWLEAVAKAPNFRFTAKLWGRFTHERQLAAGDLEQFRAGLLPFLPSGRLAALLAQFPYSFHNTEENRAYLGKIKAAFPEFSLTLEVRHRSWQSQEVKEFLRQAGWEFCNLDQPMVSYPLGATRWVTGSFGYLRCHGRNKEDWFEGAGDRQARYDYYYGPEELADLAARTRELLEKAPDVYLIFNNHPRGQALANGLEMSHLLSGRSFNLPLSLLAAFPRLSGCLGSS